MKWSNFSIPILLAASLAACGNDRASPGPADEPFSFSEAREIALPIKSMTPITSAGTLVQLRRDGPQIAKLYLDALTRFDSTYGDGVGPAKRDANYLNCKVAFHSVAHWIGSLPVANPHANIEPLWASLQRCRAFARRWSGPAEMATFGDDVGAMASGAMLVLSYAATASGLPAGRSLYAQLPLDDGAGSQAH